MNNKPAAFFGFSNFELWLAQVVVYLLLWLFNDYVATVLSLVFGGIALSIWVLIHLVELVDRSTVSRRQLRLILTCFLAPLAAGILYLALNQGLNWLR
jgi:hypothetical protein